MKNLWLLLFVLLPVVGMGQIITTFAGGGSTLGDGGPATAALINNPCGCVLLPNGTWYIACGVSNRIRKIDSIGIITTIAGNGSGGYTGDGGPATAAKIKNPTDLAFDHRGNLFFSDPQNAIIRKINVYTGIISTVCGTGVAGYNGDGIPASSAQLNDPNGICVDTSGNLFIADCQNMRIRKVDTLGIISTVAGNGVLGFSGDGGHATLARLNFPVDVAFDSEANMYVADGTNRRIRKINASGNISTFAENGVASYLGDGIPASSAQLTPILLKFDKFDNLYVTDGYNYRVYKIDSANIFHSVAGNGTMINSGDGGPATAAGIYYPCDVVIDSCSNLYISNVNYNRIRKVTFNPTCNPTLETEQIKPPSEISIYPNPATTELTISAPGKIKEVRVYDLLGRIVETSPGLSKGEEVLRIPVAGLSPGIYFVRIVDEDGGVVVRRVVKE